MKILIPAKAKPTKLASQKMRSNNLMADFNDSQETELSEIITSIMHYANEVLENEIKELSRKTKKELKQRFLEDKKYILAQLELMPLDDWDEANNILDNMINDLEELYEREIQYFNEKKLVGVSAALEKSKQQELKLLKDLHSSISNNPNTKEVAFNDEIETNDDFNRDFADMPDLSKTSSGYYEDRQSTPPYQPTRPNSIIESLGWILQAGLSAATYVMQETYKTVDNLAHKKNVVHNVIKLNGGILGAIGGGIAAYFTAGALVGGALGTVAPVVGTVVGTVVGAFIGAAMGFRAAKLTAKAASKAVTGDPNPEKWQLNDREKQNLINRRYDVSEVYAAINAIRAENENAKVKFCTMTVEKEQAVIDKLNGDLDKIKAGRLSNYKLGGKIFTFFNTNATNRTHSEPVLRMANKI